MSEKPTCPACTRKSPDNLLCHDCTTALEKDLTNLAALWTELPTTYQRQAQTSDGNGKRGDAEAPLPFSVNAATVRDSVVNTIGTWILELEHGDLPPDRRIDYTCRCEPYQACRGWRVVMTPPTMQVLTHWLLDRIQRIRGHQAAEQIMDELHYATGIVRQAVDRAGESIHCGTCEICGKELRANPDADTVTCRWCWIGGDEHTYPVPKKRANQWAGAEHASLTRAEILEALVYNGVPTNAATFRSWIHRGRLAPVEHRHNGTPLYRLGAALALARAAALTPDQTKETMTG